MIDNIIITAVAPVAEKLNANNIALTVGNSTLLGAVVHAATTPVVDNYPKDVDWQDAWLKSLKRDTISGADTNFVIGDSNDATTIVPASVCGETLHEASNIIANGVQTAIGATRTVVKPAIEKVIQTIQDEVNLKSKPIDPIEIVDIHLLPQWDHFVVKRLLDRYKNLSGTVMRRSEIPRMEKPENLDQILTSGSAEVDNLFNSLLKETGLTLSQLFNSIFHEGEDIGQWPKDWYLNRNKILAQLLFVAIASENPWIGSGMSKPAWGALFNGLANALGGLASDMMARHERDLKSKNMVIPGAGDRIYVVGELYSQWLDEGGTPEILIGLGISKNWSRSGYDELLTHKEEYLRAWRGWHTAQQYREESRRLSTIRNTTYHALSTLVSDADPSFLRTSKSQLIDLVAKAANSLEPQDCECLGEKLVEIVCDTVYPHYPAKRLIQRTDELIRRGEDPAVAQGIAIGEYINDWLTAQVGVVRSGK